MRPRPHHRKPRRTPLRLFWRIVIGLVSAVALFYLIVFITAWLPVA